MQNDLVDPSIDIRSYLQALLSRWLSIVIVTVITAVVTFIIAFLQTDVYQAQALITVLQQPRQSVQFATSIQDSREAPPIRGYPQLATSDELLLQLQAAAPDLLANKSFLELRAALSAEIGSELRIIQLAYTAEDPNEAAEVVNLWADIFVLWIDEIYGTGGNREIVFF